MGKNSWAHDPWGTKNKEPQNDKPIIDSREGSKMNLPVVKSFQRSGLDFDDVSVINVMKSTVAEGATDAEFAVFREFCKSTGLNPFKKEIWFIKTKAKSFYSKRDQKQVEVPAKVQMMAGINGFFTIANNHPQYDGMKEATYETTNDGRVISCRVEVYRKDRRFPSVGVARWDEFFPGVTEKGNGIWETKPRHMLAKVAKSIALREAFPQQLGGLYIEEEIKATQLNIKADPIEDDLPETFAPSIEDKQIAAVQKIIEDSDLVAIASHVITTKSSLLGKTVEDAINSDKETVEKYLDQFKTADRLALAAYLEAEKEEIIPDTKPLTNIMSAEEIDKMIDNLPIEQGE